LDSFDSIELSLLLSTKNLNEKSYNFDFKYERSLRSDLEKENESDES